jgi:FtsP/CotA-like multicopper oxidase with cupredoxin domain
VFQVVGTGGQSGLIASEGERFRTALVNASGIPIQMHWHGQVHAAAEQDRSRPAGELLGPDQTDLHDFELTTGTHWMHSHTLAEQQLLAAPMIALEKGSSEIQNVVVMLHDFTFRTPEEVLSELTGTKVIAQNLHAGHTGHIASVPSPMSAMVMTHANDVAYDAYLANNRTLDDPELVRVDKGAPVRLRIINGATATAFFISTPGLKSRCVAVDGSACQRVEADRYPIAQGQRLDLIVDIPKDGGAFAVLAQVEAATSLTGTVLATQGAAVRKIGTVASRAEANTDLGFEAMLSASSALVPRKADRSYALMLGEEPGYRWTINGRAHGEHRPLEARVGDRVELTFMNPTGMMHPMHLHGHHFQVVAIGGRRFSGAVRDTVIVPGHVPVTVALDARLPGSWYLHCHHLYHMATGMMTELRIA